MKNKLAAIVAATLLSVTGANAATFAQTQIQTVDGENFTFAFNGTSAPLGAGTLTFRIRGDFTIGATLGESFGFDLEGVTSQSGIQATSANLITSYDFNDNLFETSFNLTIPQLVALTADNVIHLTVDYAEGVDVALSLEPFITATINYDAALNPVPVPAALPLFASALGLGGLLGWNRKRKAR